MSVSKVGRQKFARGFSEVECTASFSRPVSRHAVSVFNLVSKLNSRFLVGLNVLAPLVRFGINSTSRGRYLSPGTIKNHKDSLTSRPTLFQVYSAHRHWIHRRKDE